LSGTRLYAYDTSQFLLFLIYWRL